MLLELWNYEGNIGITHDNNRLSFYSLNRTFEAGNLKKHF